MKSKSLSLDDSDAVAARPVTTDDLSPRIVVFVAGARPRVEAAVCTARQLYRGHELVFVCEPAHLMWIPNGPSENVVVVEQPFNPFGGAASALLRDLRSRPIEACVLVVADVGFESFRFRAFALRLQTSSFFLLQSSAPMLPKPMSRTFFAFLAGATLLLRIVLRVPGLDAFVRTVRADGVMGIPKAIVRGIVEIPKAFGRRILAIMAAWLPPLDQPLAVGLAWLAKVRMRLRPHVVQGREIVHVLPSIGMGGVQKQLLLFLGNRSPAYNHRVVFLRSRDRFFAPELRESGLSIYYLDSEAVQHSFGVSPHRQWTLSVLEPVFAVVQRSLPFCCEIIKLALFLRALQPRPDLVHCWLLYGNLAGSIAARLAGVSLVVTSVRNIQSEVNYNYYDPRWQRLLERATVPLADAITANAPAVAADYRAFARAPAKKLVTVPNGIDVKAHRLLSPEERVKTRRMLGLTAHELVVGTVARLAKEKDFETFFRAIALAHRRVCSLRCVIVGEGPLRSPLEAFASSLGLTGVVQFLGGRKDIGDLIQCYDVFLLTSVIEGMPNAVMESQLLGVPVVATRAGGTVDLIRDGETGLLAPIGDYDALATCIVRLFNETALRDRISRTAREQICNGYTVEQLVATTEAVYQALLNGNRGGLPCAE